MGLVERAQQLADILQNNLLKLPGQAKLFGDGNEIHGETVPLVGCRHRIKASAPTMLPDMNLRLKPGFKLIILDSPNYFPFQIESVLKNALKLRVKKLKQFPPRFLA